MTKPATPLSPAEQLAGFRARIDALDETIARLLLERTGIIREVAELKQTHWPSSCHIRPGREGQMHAKITRRFEDTHIPPIAALSIWRQLIGAATHIESPLTATYLAHESAHGWLAREYFGAGVGLVAESSLADMLDDLVEGRANLLLLPEGSDWWRDAALFRSHNLSIFATLPVTSQPIPEGNRALALAQVDPEPSGDDISYIAVTTRKPIEASRLSALLPGKVISADDEHHLLIVDGFLAEDSAELSSLARGLGKEALSITLLGAHPRPPL